MPAQALHAPTSGPDPKTVEERRDAAILAEWRKQQGLGPSQIRNQLRRTGIKVSVHTVRRVMEEEGFRQYEQEWWHYSYPVAGEAPAFDLEIR